METKSMKSAFQATLPVCAGYLVLGAGFGILMNRQGFEWYWSILMSCFIYAGSMQFAAVDLLSSGANLLSIALVTLAVNARHLFYGLTMLSKYKDIGKYKPYLMFSLTDETFSLVCDSKTNDSKYFLLVSILNQSYWIFGTIIGAVLGASLSFNTSGIEFSMTALFLVVMIEQWENTNNHLPALTGLVLSFVSLLLFGAQNFLIPAMIMISFVLVIGQRFGGQNHE